MGIGAVLETTGGNMTRSEMFFMTSLCTITVLTAVTASAIWLAAWIQIPLGANP
jgi:hypothetical protein